MNFKLNYVDLPTEKVYYKRRVWLGTRANPPDVNNFVHANSSTTIREDIESVNIFPCLLIWNTPEGEKQYAEVNRTINK
jgi:hypothetical protein